MVYADDRGQIGWCRWPRLNRMSQNVGRQIAAGDRRIIGAMFESHLVEGRQDIGPRENMTSCQSITDPCIGWDDTVEVLRGLADSVARRRDRLAGVP